MPFKRLTTFLARECPVGRIYFMRRAFRSDNFPYGGVKDSGYGREGIRYAMEELSEPKTPVLPDSSSGS
jgi:acyl-CoA reductase-like NAD-dependent aldehyde dehydrogenase